MVLDPDLLRPTLIVAARDGDAAFTTHLMQVFRESSDSHFRLAVMAAGLRTLGVEVAEAPGGLEIQGGRLQGGCIDSHGDHRIAMAFTVASLAASETIEILRTDEVATSFPDFIQTATHSGLKLDARPSNSEGKG